MSFKPPPARAQAAIGLHAGYNFDVLNYRNLDNENPNGAPVLGLHVHIRPESIPLIINHTLDYFFNGELDIPAL
ncbi:MAG: hypothetical protein ACE5G0_16085 [Rhodothermales bacterium]